ncbi:hypothetical protein Fcan01_07590 [Folsomia candida]|uniref:Uncharacterized protein n=2 Tax=Folsomia candida TaxID=158441 RepID=A0A226EP06_FOLCA|nr:hypothetical protein Fcan01_07590 [Folsomia candida]
MQSWYEDTTSDDDTDQNTDSDLESDIIDNIPTGEKLCSCAKQGSSKRRMRTIGLQTEDTSSLVLVNNEATKCYQNSWRWNTRSPAVKEQLCDLSAIRRIQQQQVAMLLQQNRYFGEKEMHAPLIICTEANSYNISGYLLNLKRRVCKFYVFEVRHLPWKLETSSGDWDNTEIKMKNAIFSLLLWDQEILMMKKFSAFANSWAINHSDCNFGKIAIGFLEHFTSCENIIRVNSNAQVSRHRDTEVFAKLIQPARELMCFNLSRFRQYIQNVYGILDFEGSHSFVDNFQQNAKGDGYFAKTFRFDYFLTKVNQNVAKWRKGCKKCDLKFANNVNFKTDLGSESSESDLDIMPYPLTDNSW